MGDGLQIHPESHRHHLRRDHNGDEEREHIAEQRRRFEAKHDQARPDESVKTADSIASCALLGESKVSDEPWEGDPETERENFVQEELYVHAKVPGQPMVRSLETLCSAHLGLRFLSSMTESLSAEVLTSTIE